MTPKEKANELVDMFDNIDVLGEEHNGYIAQQCALIAVDEIIASNPIAFDEQDNCIAKQWWQEVKIEIEKL
jgi:hypothetical protein